MIKENKQKYSDRLLKAIGVDTEQKEAKLVEAPTIKNNATFQIPSHSMIQADLIYMPDDDGYKYVLTVVDVGYRKVDAEPLRDRQGVNVIDGFKAIFRRKYIDINKVKYCYSDQGSEFKNEDVKAYFDNERIILRHTWTNRKTQTGVVEHFNYLLGGTLQKKMTIEELQNGRTNKWRKDLPKLVKAINNERDEKDDPKIRTLFKDPKVSNNEDILEEGTKVHIVLPQPTDATTGKRMHGGFRTGDQRFETKTRKIDRALIYPNQPVRYMVEGIKNVSFFREELKLASEYKQKTPPVTEQIKTKHTDVMTHLQGQIKNKKQELSGKGKYPHMKN